VSSCGRCANCPTNNSSRNTTSHASPKNGGKLPAARQSP
jgi:hypothetical protein